MPARTFHIFKITSLTLVALGVGFLGYGGYTTYTASTTTQHVMRQSKTVKEVYGQGKKGKQEHANRLTFDKIYYKYVKQDDSTVVNTKTKIPASAVTQINRLVKNTGAYYVDAYTDRAKTFTLLATVQNDYVSLWKKGKVNETFAKNVTPSKVYAFNSNNYNNLQTLLAINPNSQYPVWMTEQMQAMGNDGIQVENLMQTFSKYFTFPTLTASWKVSHDFTSVTEGTLSQRYSQLQYKWPVISFMPELLDASMVAGYKNERMQAKLDAANAKIASIRASSIAESNSIKAASSAKEASESSAKASSELKASSEKAAAASEKADSESRAAASKAASEAAESAKNNTSSSSSTRSTTSSSASSSSKGSSSSVTMPNYVGQAVDTAVAWAKSHNVTLMTQAITSTDNTHADGEVAAQTKRGNTYYISYYKVTNTQSS